MQTSLVYLFGEPNVTTRNARFLAANATATTNTNSSINNIICWDECVTMNTTNTSHIDTNTNTNTNATLCSNECIDLDAIDITQTETCWNECFTLDTTNSANMTANATNTNTSITGITDRNIAYDVIDDLMNNNTDANTGDLICLKDCIDTITIPSPSPTGAPKKSIKDLINDAIGDSSGEMNDDEWNPSNLSDGVFIRQTLNLYGSIFVVSLALFCVVRKMFPRAYNLRSGWISEDRVKSNLLAKNPEKFGCISWMWKVWLVSDVELTDECGMDALCVSRVLEWGTRLTLFGSLVGCLLLMPVYATAGGVHDGEKGIERINTSNVPNGSQCFLATVVAAYLVFGYVMYTTLEEFEWFYKFRYEFLTRSIPRNYVVYIRNLPEEYRTKKALIDYFSQFEEPSTSMGGEERLGLMLGDHNNYNALNNALNSTKAWVSLKIPCLKELVEKRAAVISKLERQINVKDLCDTYPKTRCATTGRIISLVDALFAEVEELNAEITVSIDKIEMRASLENPKEYNAADYQNPYREDKSENGEYMGGYAKSPTKPLFFDAKAIDSFGDPKSKTTVESLEGVAPGYIGDELTDMEEEEEIIFMSSDFAFTDKVGIGSPSSRSSMAVVVGKVGKGVGKVGKGVGKVGNVGKVAANVVGTQVLHNAKIVGTQVGKTAKIVGTQVGKAANLVPFLGSKEDDGAPLTAGFVAFSTLKACQAAKQMVHSREVFGMEVFEAPGFDDIFWMNVGKTHKELQLGLLLSFCLTITLCLFWTIVMAAIATLSSVQGLVIIVPVIGRWMETTPRLESLVAQISPLMIIVADEFLKVILEFLSGLEGPVSGMVVQASLFTKISTFKLIQTFFVNAVSGSLVSQLSAISKNPSSEIVTLVSFDYFCNRWIEAMYFVLSVIPCLIRMFPCFTRSAQMKYSSPTHCQTDRPFSSKSYWSIPFFL